MTLIRSWKEVSFAAPVRNPGGSRRLETWMAESLCGLWLYQRVDDDGTPWTVTYRPTGQDREGFMTLPAAQRATAGELKTELRAEALRAAFAEDLDVTARAEAQRWLAVYLREAAEEGKPVELGGDCRCGGTLIRIKYQGQELAAHVDVCRGCWPAGETVPRAKCDTCEHRFCADAAPAAAR